MPTLRAREVHGVPKRGNRPRKSGTLGLVEYCVQRDLTYPFTPIKMAIIKKVENNKGW